MKDERPAEIVIPRGLVEAYAERGYTPTLGATLSGYVRMTLERKA